MPDPAPNDPALTINPAHLFKNRRLVIATMHHKETVINPLVEKYLEAKPFVPDHFDTDKLGTFCGNVERQGDPVSVLRQKCRMAMEKFSCDMGIASEGSFGPHPYLLGIPVDHELVIFIDNKNQLEIMAEEISTRTNFLSGEVKTIKQLHEFARQAEFPEHGLILRSSFSQPGRMYKGLTSWKALLMAHRQLIRAYGTAYAETDMRAKFNPTRMSVIKNAAEKLMKKIQSCCPVCMTPGFDIREKIQGLPCRQCKAPTRSALSHRYVCSGCNYVLEKKFPDQRSAEDPMYCDFCNP